MMEPEAEAATAHKKPSALQRLLFLGLTGLCFAYLYYRLNGAAGREGLPLVDYMSQVFSDVAWLPWLFLMVAYSFFYFFIDTLVVTRVLLLFIIDIHFSDIIQIRD